MCQGSGGIFEEANVVAAAGSGGEGLEGAAGDVRWAGQTLRSRSAAWTGPASQRREEGRKAVWGPNLFPAASRAWKLVKRRASSVLATLPACPPARLCSAAGRTHHPSAGTVWRQQRGTTSGGRGAGPLGHYAPSLLCCFFPLCFRGGVGAHLPGDRVGEPRRERGRGEGEAAAGGDEEPILGLAWAR
ncbi:hypothetical protein BDZ91DRAFT_762771 [Kalaharituber pfeilii]|nr:hypothetical protein BDZ91DRAFT_762771 [Kalaharituber pfeilii]